MGNKRTEIVKKSKKETHWKRTFSFHRRLGIEDLLKQASQVTGKSMQAFVEDAIFDAAEKLGLETKRNCQDETEDTEN